MSTVLIAGCGYVGTALGERLAAQGNTVWGLRRNPAGLPPSIRPLAADLNDPDTLGGLPRDVCDVVYAASPSERSDAAYADAYVHGPRNLLRALAEQRAPVRRVVLTTSTAVYGQRDGRWVDEGAPTEPQHFSGRRLVEAEQALRGLPFAAVAVRLAGIYGPGRTGLARRVREGTARIPRTPRYSNRIHREDCAGVLQHVLALPDPEPVYIAADCEPADLAEVIRWLAARLAVDPPPYEETANDADTRRGRSNKRCRNDRLIASGFRFAYPTFRTGYDALLDEPAEPAGP